MKFFFVTFHLLLALTCSHCSSQDVTDRPDTDPELVLKDFREWWNYNFNHINFSQNYIPLDIASKVITKDSFLQLLCSGKYIPLKLISKDARIKYKLYKLNDRVNSEIRIQIKQIGVNEYRHYKMEGTKLPDFEFTDLEGKVYNNETTKGKIIVVKCWFIHCVRCVEEMPALNEIIKLFQNRNDIMFISLALDSKEKLKDFLAKTRFDYAVVPAQERYLSEALNIYSYPTHLVINKDGIITKVVDNYKDMLYSLNQICLKITGEIIHPVKQLQDIANAPSAISKIRSVRNEIFLILT